VFVKKLSIFFLSPLLLQAADWASVDLYHPSTPMNHWHLQGSGRLFAPAHFHTRSRGKLHAADAAASLFFSHYIHPNIALCWEAGYNFMHLGWKNNPRFSQTDFQIAKASLTVVSKDIPEWRWIAQLGGSADAERLVINHAGVIYGFLWGSYHCTSSLGLHFGMCGHYGIRNGYALPILGMDWQISSMWKTSLIFPFDFSLTFFPGKGWSLALATSSFGGPYRYPWRAHGTKGGFKDPILQAYSFGGELQLAYKWKDTIRMKISGGENFGGWLFIENRYGHKGKYFHYNPAPYVQADLAMSF